MFISRSSKLADDPLSDMLALLNPRGYMSGGIDAGGDWAIRFDRDALFRCFAIVSGSCWLSIETRHDPLLLTVGDVLILPHAHAFRLASDPSVKAVDIMQVLTGPLNGDVFRWQGGGKCLALNALFSFDGVDADILLRSMPPFLHLRDADDHGSLRWYVERMMRAIREPQPGGVLLGEHLAQLMLIEALGLYARHAGSDSAGWLSGWGDRQINAALTALHRQPGSRWTLESLAARVGMSRSALASRFKAKLGHSPMQYLTRWRMLRAAHQLTHSKDSVSSVALSLGYASESAFTFAFRREMGCTPRQYPGARQPANRSEAPGDDST